MSVFSVAPTAPGPLLGCPTLVAVVEEQNSPSEPSLLCVAEGRGTVFPKQLQGNLCASPRP